MVQETNRTGNKRSSTASLQILAYWLVLSILGYISNDLLSPVIAIAGLLGLAAIGVLVSSNMLLVLHVAEHELVTPRDSTEPSNASAVIERNMISIALALNVAGLSINIRNKYGLWLFVALVVLVTARIFYRRAGRLMRKIDLSSLWLVYTFLLLWAIAVHINLTLTAIATLLLMLLWLNRDPVKTSAEHSPKSAHYTMIVSTTVLIAYVMFFTPAEFMLSYWKSMAILCIGMTIVLFFARYPRVLLFLVLLLVMKFYGTPVQTEAAGLLKYAIITLFSGDQVWFTASVLGLLIAFTLRRRPVLALLFAILALAILFLPQVQQVRDWWHKFQTFIGWVESVKDQVPTSQSLWDYLTK